MKLNNSGVLKTAVWHGSVFAVVSVLIFLFSPSCTSSEGKKLPLMNPGEPLSLTEFTDQFGQKAVIPSDTRYLVFSADMDGGKIIRGLAESKGGAFLKENKIAAVGDIHGMPSIIASTIAIPKMKKYDYTMYLIRTSGTGEAFSKKSGQVTVYTLNNLVIEKIEYAATKEDLLALLK